MLQRKTLLEIVQSTLGSLDSDLVNHIGETQESEQIAILAQEQYLELVTYQHVPQLVQLTQLEGLSDLDRPSVMRIPEGATDVADIRYRYTNTHGLEVMREIEWLEKSDFLDRQLRLPVRDNMGDNLLDGNVSVPYINDRDPQYATTFDNEHIVFDAVDQSQDPNTTLHNDDSLVLAYIIPEFKLEDDFVPVMPVKMLTQYMNQIKEIASYEQRQYNNPFRTRDSERQQHRNKHFGGIYDGLDQGQGSTRERETQGRPIYGRYGFGRLGSYRSSRFRRR